MSEAWMVCGNTKLDRYRRLRLARGRELTAALRAARRGDDAAFLVLYRAVQADLERALVPLVGDDAEDVAAEVWLSVVRNLRSFEGHYDGFRAMVAAITRFRVLDHQRARRRRLLAEVPIELAGEVARRAGPGDIEAETVSLDAALRLIKELPPDQAEAIFLRVILDLDAATAGRVLGKSAGAVRSAAHRGLRRMARHLGDPASIHAWNGK